VAGVVGRVGERRAREENPFSNLRLLHRLEKETLELLLLNEHYTVQIPSYTCLLANSSFIYAPSVESLNIASVQFSSNMSHYRVEKGDTYNK